MCGAVEAGGQDVDVAQVTQWSPWEQAVGFFTAKPHEQLVAFAGGRIAADESALDAMFRLERRRHVPPMFTPAAKIKHAWRSRV
jgi:hypothetical protein